VRQDNNNNKRRRLEACVLINAAAFIRSFTVIVKFAPPQIFFLTYLLTDFNGVKRLNLNSWSERWDSWSSFHIFS